MPTNLQQEQAVKQVQTVKKGVLAVIIGQLNAGGSERQLYLFLQHCDYDHWSPKVFVSGELGAWRDEIVKLGIPVTLLHGNRLAKMWRFRQACLTEGVTCFFSWSSYTNAYAAALLGSNVRKIGSFRNSSFDDLPKMLRKFWEFVSLQPISVAVCNSLETRTRIKQRANASKDVVYVPNGVEFLTPEEIIHWRAFWRKKLLVAGDAILVVGVGRLTPQKNFQRFISVIAQAVQILPIRAVIAGPGAVAQRTALEETIAESGLKDVLGILGYIPNAQRLICAADLFLLTSDHEGMPNVVLEAMACGVPCVSTDVHGVRELIVDGSTGFIVDFQVTNLAQRVIELGRNSKLRYEMGARARQSISKYRPEKVAAQLWKLCESDDGNQKAGH